MNKEFTKDNSQLADKTIEKMLKFIILWENENESHMIHMDVPTRIVIIRKT